MTPIHWFWTLIMLASLLWYSTVTLFVAFRGVADIRHMLARLRMGNAEEERENPDSE
ncbi:MAG: hypothetical protein KA184_06645 [Candidatus Hydrogenedentes bacterium]|nr:hypothetical protein [Candidatus Hydrogenedentota bacterium]